MKLDVAFTPSDVYPLVGTRCITELRKIRTNADLNDTDSLEIRQHLG